MFVTTSNASDYQSTPKTATMSGDYKTQKPIIRYSE